MLFSKYCYFTIVGFYCSTIEYYLAKKSVLSKYLLDEKILNLYITILTDKPDVFVFQFNLLQYLAPTDLTKIQLNVIQLRYIAHVSITCKGNVTLCKHLTIDTIIQSLFAHT